MNLTSYSISYSLLIKDFETLIEYIYPVDNNLSIYSHRTFELFLRICTEFENICKEKLIEMGSTKAPKDFNITDYNTLHAPLTLGTYEVGMQNFYDTDKKLKPFNDWNTLGTPLAWYSAYNKVKHNRTAEFAQASFANILLSLGGLTLVLYKLFGERVFHTGNSMAGNGGGSTIQDGIRYSQRHVNGCIFTFHTQEPV